MQVLRTPRFERWLNGLRDLHGRSRIALRLDALEQLGHFGSMRSVGNHVSELKVDVGPGYRIYFTRRGADVVLLLAGGDKSTQARDILEAQRLARILE